MNHEYRAMMCPVCNDFYFSELQEGDEIEKLQCLRCGWRYDLKQAENTNLCNGANSLSLDAYRKWYSDKKIENPDFDYLEDNLPDPIPHKCPVCGKYEFEDECCFDICPYCGWEDDGADEDDSIIGANEISFSVFQNRYFNYLETNPDYKWKKDGCP